MAVRILVIQFRNDEAGIEAEKSAFFRTIGKISTLTFKNALRDEVAWSQPRAVLAVFDGVILPGSAELYFDGGHHDEHEGRVIANKIAEAAKPFVQYLIQNDIPTLGICFGHQLLAYASGAPVRYSTKEGKTGTMRIGIDAAGENDPLLAGLPKNFFGQYVHKDAVADLPGNATVLASNRDRCRHAILRYGPHVYSVQFHPERTREDCIASMQRAPEYLEAGADPNEIFKETPRSPQVLLNFVYIVQSRLSHFGDFSLSEIRR
ncbi:type 1 glutamine amidotransferase [Candidatus Kaiserbacteria bacterium]|nr:type 1 glutamine amidotransferase [Candidatus Kaiserbacteria bacterium]